VEHTKRHIIKHRSFHTDLLGGDSSGAAYRNSVVAPELQWKRRFI
jgi:hypothetical protein